jgi:hypothetical protein
MTRPSLSVLRALALLLAVGSTGCAAVRDTGNAEPRERATVEIENQGFADVRVYALRNTERIRLGSVPGLSTRVLAIPPHLTVGLPVRFLAEPLASNARPTSQEITVHPGDQLRLVVRQ